MGISKLGRTYRPQNNGREYTVEHVGIPGSGRSALFYQDKRALPMVDSGDGIYIFDKKGKRYIDACSGAISANLGHGNKRVVKAALKQMEKISFTYRTQFESEPSNELAELLAKLGPPELNRVFFVNSGSEAVEASLKLARQFWWAQGEGSKSLVISRRPSYHGATLGALSCTDYAPLNIPFRPHMLHFPKVSAPYCYHCPLWKEYPSCEMACAHELERLIRLHGPENIAAFITEPIGGASTGAAVPPDEYFPIIERVCNENRILLIIDDVMTGCGRTGTFYGFEHWSITPDIVAISKGLSGGYTPIGATIASDEIVKPVLDSGGFLHGHTYAGNPLSTAIACEVIKIIVDDGLLENSRIIGTYMHERLHEIKAKYPFIGDVRGRGLFAGVEFVRDRVEREPYPAKWFVAQEATEIARELGLLLYPRRSLFGLQGDHVLIAPPLIIDRVGIDEMIDLFDRTMTELMKLLDRYYDEEVAAAVPVDGTVARYHQSEEVPEYAIGILDHVEPQPDANVTRTMEGSEYEVRQDFLEDGEIR